MPRKQVVVRVDQARFDQVAGILVESLRAKVYPFNVATRPQDMVPPDIRANKLVHSLLLFGTCYFMRGTIQSDFAIRQIVRIYRAHPEIFDPNFLSEGTVEEKVQHVYECLKGFIKYRLFEIPPMWVDGFRRIKEDWDGDPRNIFVGVYDSTELYRRIVNIDSLPKHKRGPNKLRGIVGIRAKIANMLTYFYEDAALIPVGQVKTSSPFDFHNGRAFICTEAIRLEGEGPFRFEDVTDIGSATVEAYGIAHGLTMREMSDAFWLLSTWNCRRAPGNKTVGRDRLLNKRKGQRHKLDYKPKKRKKQKLELYQPDWSLPNDIKKHELTCGRCPLAKLCVYNVAAGFFYEQGVFVTQPRDAPPPNLFGDELHYHAPDKPKVVETKAKPKKKRLPALPGLGIRWVAQQA